MARASAEISSPIARLSGVAFTGSNETAALINRALAAREGAIIPFIAETGGMNAMIVDSSALPEQAVRDVLASAFDSAGQRCSAARILFVQDDIAEPVDRHAQRRHGGTAASAIPATMRPMSGPVIDKEAQGKLDRPQGEDGEEGRTILDLPLDRAAGREPLFRRQPTRSAI